MKWPLIGILAACLFVVPSPTLAQTSLILPRADFPAHTVIKVYRNVSNSGFDRELGCQASFGDPFFHDVCADALNRTGGWVQTGALLGKKASGRQIGFDVVASSFQTPNDAGRAYADFGATVQGPDWGGKWGKVSSPVAVESSSSVAAFRLSDPSAGIWGEGLIEASGTTEIEVVAFWTKKKDSSTVRTLLVKELTDAIAAGLNP